MERDIYLSLGTNLGDREDNLRRAVSELISKLGPALKLSSIYETEPWGYLDQPKFINMCAVFKSSAEPIELLFLVKDIERNLGRAKSVKWGPRIIDIDILLVGSIRLISESITLPHPRMWERAFVIVPLAEIAPDLMGPGGVSCLSLAKSLDPDRVVRRAGALYPDAKPDLEGK
jgi:2-amino-4-hydroxy-6-hydroxymethyldihydropteridine diphosphokinase